VTEAACKLQKKGVIAYSRGRIEILDRARLEQLSCECYAVIRGASEMALGRLYPAPAARPMAVPMPAPAHAHARPAPLGAPLAMSA
jgi:hypothetical protein